MSETKAEFAERTKHSLKNILYRYMEVHGFKYIHKVRHFSATIFYSKQLGEYKKLKIGIGDRVRISKYDLLFRKDYKPHFTQEFFEIVAIAT